jgi:hypothetical protein
MKRDTSRLCNCFLLSIYSSVSSGSFDSFQEATAGGTPAAEEQWLHG